MDLGGNRQREVASTLYDLCLISLAKLMATLSYKLVGSESLINVL
jgi:hypothetical protein